MMVESDTNQNICSNVVCVPGAWGTHSQYSGYDLLADRLEDLGARVERPRAHSFAARLAAKIWLEASGLSSRKLCRVYGARTFLDERRLRLSAAGSSIVHFLSAENSFSFLRRANIVCTFHGTQRNHAASLVNREPLKAVRAAIALTPDMARYLLEMIQDVVVIPYGVDPKAFAPASPSLKHPERLRLAVVGSFMRDFDALERVLAATADRKNLEFSILGPLEQTRRFIRFSHCRVLPRLPYPEYRALLQGSDALFLPLIDAAANTAILEAMACALPIVTNGGGGPAYYIGDGGWLYERTEDVVELFKEPSFKEECLARGAKARARALDKFSWDKIVPQVLELYGRLAG